MHRMCISTWLQNNVTLLLIERELDANDVDKQNSQEGEAKSALIKWYGTQRQAEQLEMEDKAQKKLMTSPSPVGTTR